MPIDYQKLMAYTPPAREHSYSETDTILYALGVGLGHDPVDEDQLRFVFEKNLSVLPTMACVTGYTPIRDLDLGADYTKLLHGDQTATFHKPLPTSGTVVSKISVRDVVDRDEKGAIIYLDRDVIDKASGDLLATLTMGIFCRGEGGFGGPNKTTPPLHAIPDRDADEVCELPTIPQAALIYRLCGDLNPLHADPEMARKVGFKRPILHGLATYGIVGHAVLKSACGYDPARLASLSGRFSAPVYPGETISTEIWRDGQTISFRATAKERDVVVINNGKAEIRPE